MKTVLKGGIVAVFYAIYFVIFYTVNKSTFDKIRFSADGLMLTRVRRPYLAAIFNTLREQFFESMYTNTSELSTFRTHVGGRFDMVYKNMQENERELYKLEVDLEDYYPSLAKRFHSYLTSQLCEIAGSRIAGYLKEECKTVMNGIMMQGLRGALSIIMLNLYKMHEEYEYGDALTPSEVMSGYLNDTKSNNLCNSSATLSGPEERVPQLHPLSCH